MCFWTCLFIFSLPKFMRAKWASNEGGISRKTYEFLMKFSNHISRLLAFLNVFGVFSRLRLPGFKESNHYFVHVFKRKLSWQKKLFFVLEKHVIEAISIAFCNCKVRLVLFADWFAAYTPAWSCWNVYPTVLLCVDVHWLCVIL